MRRALSLASRGWGRVHPNPMVGALVVRGGVIVGTGYHREYGGPHAEVEALREAGARARGATLYVTLEPCAHYGKTPPCTEAILEAGIARVVYAARDPHDDAAGGGDRLRCEGLAVTGGVEEAAARRLNIAYFHAVERRSTYVALKYGLTLDARLSAIAGHASVVTGPAAHAEVHRLRAGFDAIMIGAATARIDDPRLTARGRPKPRVPPVRIVLDADATLPRNSRLAATTAEAPVWVFCAPDAPPRRREALEAAGVRLITVPRAPGGLDLHAVLDRAWELGVRSILCEGGGRLGAALLEAQRVRRMYLFYAPRVFGQAGTPAFPGAFEGAGTASGWKVVETRKLGSDALIVIDRED